MGAKIFAVVTLVVIICLACADGAMVTGRIDEIRDDIEAAEDPGEVEAIREKYRRYERLISISVSHEDLMAVEDLMAQYECEIRMGEEGAQVTKSRLISAIAHLKRLSTINIDSII